MKILMALALVACGAHAALAQTADSFRGGWRTDDADPHTYEFSIRGETVRGIYCTLCSDATTLAFIDGRLEAGRITFVVTHVQPDGRTAYQDKATARIDGNNLIVTGTSGSPRGGGTFQRTLYRDPRGPDPLPVPVAWLPDATGRLVMLAPLGRGGGPARGAVPPGSAGAPAGAAAPGGAAAAPFPGLRGGLARHGPVEPEGRPSGRDPHGRRMTDICVLRVAAPLNP